jgi:iron complex outermembrane receptor protein
VEVRWLHKYVSRQYLDNTGDKFRSLAPYYFSELWVNKDFKLKKGGAIAVQLQVLNVFNARYASNGYTFMYRYGSPDITQEVFVYPQAGRNLLGKVMLKF